MPVLLIEVNMDRVGDDGALFYGPGIRYLVKRDGQFYLGWFEECGEFFTEIRFETGFNHGFPFLHPRHNHRNSGRWEGIWLIEEFEDCHESVGEDESVV